MRQWRQFRPPPGKFRLGAAPGDVTDEAAVEGYIGEVLRRWGRIDILVNNAALLGGKRVLDETAADFERAIRVSALGYFLNTKHVGRAMAARGIKGSIVCISSSNGWSGTAGVIAYAFGKGGVNNFVRAAAMDLAPYGIRVNSFTPTAPNPDNPELLAERAKAGLGPGGVLTHGRGPGLGGRPETSRGAGRPGGPGSECRWCRWGRRARRPTSAMPSRGCVLTTPG